MPLKCPVLSCIIKIKDEFYKQEKIIINTKGELIKDEK